MTKNIGIGAKRVLPVPTTKFERDLVIAITDILNEIDDALTKLETTTDDHETRITALEP